MGEGRDRAPEGSKGPQLLASIRRRSDREKLECRRETFSGPRGSNELARKKYTSTLERKRGRLFADMKTSKEKISIGQ